MILPCPAARGADNILEQRKATVISAISVLVVSVATPAWGQPSPYCREVRSRAAADAALLAYPRLIAEGVRFPASGRIDPGPTIGYDVQARFGLSVSPLDIYRGQQLARAADADCERSTVLESLRQALTDAGGQETVRALRAQVDYLEAHEGAWRTSMANAQERLQAGIINLLELHELRRLVDILERKIETARGEAERLEARVPKGDVSVGLTMLSQQYTDRSLSLERELASLRALDPWTVRLTGAVIPAPGRPTDWFVQVEVSYSLGGLVHGRRDADYLEARADEVAQERRELPAQARELRDMLLARLGQTQRELRVIEGDLAFLAGARRALESTPAAPNIGHESDMLLVEELSAEADRVFLTTLKEALVARTEEQSP
jgi:hypothetical protein